MSWDALAPLVEKARERYLLALEGLTPEQLRWRAAPGSNSVGFLIRHIAEVEYIFAAMFFGRPLPEGVALRTLGRDVTDDGTHTDLEELQSMLRESYEHLTAAVRDFPEDRWDAPVESRIGVMTPREALGRLVYHTGYHAGQIGLIRKYGGAV